MCFSTLSKKSLPGAHPTTTASDFTGGLAGTAVVLLVGVQLGLSARRVRRERRGLDCHERILPLLLLLQPPSPVPSAPGPSRARRG